MHAGNWDAVLIDDNDGSCSLPNLDHISTLAECKKAALLLGKTAQVEEGDNFHWPYCYMVDDTVYFDPTGAERGNGDLPRCIGAGEDGLSCVCKKGAVHTTCPLLHLY